MIIHTSRPATVPRPIASEVLAAEPSADGCPGLVVSTKPLLEQNHKVASSVTGMIAPRYPHQFPALLSTPTTTSSLFAHTKELAFLKSAASLIIEQVRPQLKLGVDAVWLVYGAAQLHDEWTKPGADAGVCAFKLASLGLSAAHLAGGISPDLKLPDAWSNGINFFIKHGQAIYQGKTPPIIELTLGMDKRMDIPLKLLSFAGISLDGPPESDLGRPRTMPSIALVAPNGSARK